LDQNILCNFIFEPKHREVSKLHCFLSNYFLFYKNIFRRSNQKRDTLIKVSDEDYIIEDTGWKLKTFPPNKDKYPIYRLVTMK